MPYEGSKKKTATAARSRGKDAKAPKKRARTRRSTKVSTRTRTGRDTAGTLGHVGEQRPLIRLLEALEAEKIRYILIGMSAAVAQGVMANTLDIDLWIDLPSRQYIKVLNLSRGLGAEIAANTVVYLQDGVPVNFVYEVTGLGKFSNERKHTVLTSIYGHAIPVLKLERILKSKEAIRRDKDELHILHIREFLRLRKKSKA